MKTFLSQNKFGDIFFGDEVFDGNYFRSKHNGGFFFKTSSFRKQAVPLFLKFLGNYRGLTTSWKKTDKCLGASGLYPPTFLPASYCFYTAESVGRAGFISAFTSDGCIQPAIGN